MDPGKYGHARNGIPGIPPSQNRIDDVTSGYPIPRAALGVLCLPDTSPRPRASVFENTQARKYAHTCSDTLPQILVGVDPVFRRPLRRPTAPAGKSGLKVNGCISKSMNNAFGKSLKKYEENMDLLLETIKRSNYKNMSIIYVAYLDSIGWNFDGPAPDRELLYGMDSPLAKTLSAYHEELRPPREPSKRSKDMELFDIAEKEYLDSLGPREPEPVEFPNERFCSEGCEHRFIGIDGERTCRECGLMVGRTRYVSEYGCWDRAIMKRKYIPATIREKVRSFIVKKEMSGQYLFRETPRQYPILGGVVGEVMNWVVYICEAEEPREKRIPNLNIMIYQVCKMIDVNVDESLLKIPRGGISHGRRRKLFQKLGFKYTE